MKTTCPRLQYGKTIRPSKNGTSPSCAVGRNTEVAASSRMVKAPGPSIKVRATLGSPFSAYPICSRLIVSSLIPYFSRNQARTSGFPISRW